MAEFNHDDTTSWDAEDVRRQREAFRFSEEEGNRQREREARERARERVAARRRRRQRNRWIALGIKIPLYFVFVLATSALLAEWGWMLASDFCAFGQGDRRTASVVVTMDDNVRDVSEKLYDAGLIKYRWFFRLFARFAHAEEKIGAGVYELNTDMDYQALIRGMRNSSGSMTTEQVRITIPEGYNVYDIISLLAKNGVATREELEEAARTAEFKYDFIDNDSEDISRLEGYLFPDTYDFFKPERP
ncbi:MAG: endolytic transglycosylase MltG, partial [Oscillibacter sp.]|nr:endolytic transglycosylase MltG [Oscillibacter sp.]